MIQKVVKAEKLTPEGFKPFGTVLVPQTEKPTITSEVLDCWDVKDLGLGDGLVQYITVKSRPFAFSKMERHVKTPEVLIPLDGSGIFPLAPASKLDDPKALPPVDEITAFVLDGTKAVILEKGVWHWPPFPITETASYLVMFRKGTVEDDLDIKDLAAKGVTIRLTL